MPQRVILTDICLQQPVDTCSEIALVLVIGYSYEGHPKWGYAGPAFIVWSTKKMFPAAPNLLPLFNPSLKLRQVSGHIYSNVLLRGRKV
jgi:hypothetical protein